MRLRLSNRLDVKKINYRSHAVRGNAFADAVRHCVYWFAGLKSRLLVQATLERLGLHSHAQRGNDVLSVVLICW